MVSSASAAPTSKDLKQHHCDLPSKLKTFVTTELLIINFYHTVTLKHPGNGRRNLGEHECNQVVCFLRW